ncbi:MAG: alpha/beta fold hydrolase [Spirochaetes bacterium]|jgi:esterase/lipase|nr:alpha/beta fold hydrolase [Spirochaetota bacterium]
MQGSGAGPVQHRSTGIGSGEEIDVTELDARLEASEGRFADILPGTEKTILWAGQPSSGGQSRPVADSATPRETQSATLSATPRRTPLSIIYLHGFSATRQELSPTIERVAENLGANVFFTRFAGHGRSDDALGEASIADWKRDAREAWRIGTQIGERVVIVGTSTGAAIAAWLAAEVSTGAVADTPGARVGRGAAGEGPGGVSDTAGAAPDGRLVALVLISPNFALADSRARVLLWPGGRILARLMAGKYRSFEPENELHAKYWTERYPSSALVEMMKATRLGNRADLKSVTAPAIMFYTEQDTVISLPRAHAAFDRLGGTENESVQVPEARGHVLAGSIISPAATDRVVNEIVRFVRPAAAHAH